MENVTLIEYRGSIRYETIGELIQRFKLVVPKTGIPIGIYKRILLVMIESLENMMKHSPSAATEDAVISVEKNDNSFFVTTSNPLSRMMIPKLKEKIDYLNNLDAAGLKNIYKETITNGLFTKTGGAGLGLIEIAKISGSPIYYEFQPLDDQNVRYFQRVEIHVK